MDKALVANALPIEMVWVPGGSFELGKNLGTGGGSDITPVSTVTLTGFHIGKFPVTQAEYMAVTETNPGSDSYASAGDIKLRRPVSRVSWYEAIVFCNKLSMLEGLSPAYLINSSTNPSNWGTVPHESYRDFESDTGLWDAVVIVPGSTGYRLLTEAQWEYAAKGGNGSPGNFTFAGSDDPDEVAWYRNNTNRIREVGLKTSNGLGIYDMSGNVFEWCWDWRANYTSDVETDPAGPASGNQRVRRGGSYDSSLNDDSWSSSPRSVSRSGETPHRNRWETGFRVARP